MIPDRYGKHTLQPRQKAIPMFFIEVQKDFGICAGAEAVSFGKKFFSKGLEVIDLTVKNYPYRALFVLRGLVAFGG